MAKIHKPIAEILIYWNRVLGICLEFVFSEIDKLYFLKKLFFYFIKLNIAGFLFYPFIDHFADHLYFFSSKWVLKKMWWKITKIIKTRMGNPN